MNNLTPQQQRILALLKDAGRDGINSYGYGRQLALQLPAVVLQLKRHGYSIVTRRLKNRSATYILVHTPPQPKEPKTKKPVEFEWVFRNGSAVQVPKVPFEPVQDSLFGQG